MRVILLIGVVICLASVVIQTNGASTAAKQRPTAAPSTQEATTKASQDKRKKKAQFKKKLGEAVANIAKNNKPLTDEDMKKGEDLLTNGPKKEKVMLEELKKEDNEAKKAEKSKKSSV